MSNPLNDPLPILLTDRLSTATGAARLRAVDAGADRRPGGAPPGWAAGVAAGASAEAAAAAAPAPERLLDSVFGPLMLRPLVAADALAHADFLLALGERGRRLRGFSLPAALSAAPSLAGPAPSAGKATAGLGAMHLRLGLGQAPAFAPSQTPASAPAPAQAQARARAQADPGGRLLGELCVSIDRSRVAAEFALAVRPALQGRGLGRLLLHCLLDLCLARRVTLACASVPGGSPAMLALAHDCGFQILRAADGSAQLALMLRPRGVR